MASSGFPARPEQRRGERRPGRSAEWRRSNASWGVLRRDSSPCTPGRVHQSTCPPSDGTMGLEVSNEGTPDGDDMNDNPLGLKRVHHLEFWVGNARQAACFYRKAFGFSQIAYSGLETGKRKRTSYVMRQ